jgi:nitrogen fixation/metabolism regulation signal transduction histidine kinase
LLILSVVAATWLALERHFFLASMTVCVAIYCLHRLKICYDKFNKNIIFLLNALENGDYTYHFSDHQLAVREREINLTLNRIKEILENARTQVIENEHFLSIILESVSTGIIIANEAGNVHKVNLTAREMLGLPIFTHLNQLQNIDASFPEIFKNLNEGENCQLALTNERESFPVSLRVSKIRLKRGLVRVFTLNNIANELEMNEMESWIRLIRVMTHEIMNSIAPITSLSETMMQHHNRPDVDKSPDNETLLAFETINTTASGLLSFVESYRKFTAIPVPKKEMFDLAALVDKVATLHRQAALEKRINIVVDPCVSPVFIFADENLIQQVVINLVKNALEAPDCKNIILRILFRDENLVILETLNDGDSIPAEALPHIFVPFFTTKTNGSGIGLSVSRYIMRLHGGTLQHRQTTDDQTVFQLSLPVKMKI